MIPDEYLKEFGRFVINFENLSLRISYIIWALVGSQYKGMAITSKTSFSRLCDLAISLSKLKETNLKPEEIEEIEEIEKIVA